MTARRLLVGTVLGALTLFVWQTVSNALLPWHGATMRSFTDGSAVVEAIRANAPVNGVYFAPQGILAAVSFTPDMADRTQAIGGRLGKQVVIDLVAALLLSLAVLRLPVTSATATGVTLGLIGLAAGVVTQLSDWNWYGFSTGYAVVNLLDLGIAWFLAGVVLGRVAKRAPSAEASTAGSTGGRAGAAGPA